MTALMSQMPAPLEKLSESADFTLSTENVKLLSSMPDSAGSCFDLERHALEVHERAGYKLCSHVEDFISTQAVCWLPSFYFFCPFPRGGLAGQWLFSFSPLPSVLIWP